VDDVQHGHDLADPQLDVRQGGTWRVGDDAPAFHGESVMKCCKA
jgi:hypothetical protein